MIYQLVIASLLVCCVYSTVQLEECNTVYCLSDPVQYRCIVTVTGPTTLLWRIRDETMMSIGTDSYSSLEDPDPASFTPITAAAVFSTDLSSTSPSIISNISFTVQSSIDGYTIECGDGNGNEICAISIEDIPDNPSNVTIHTDTFTDSSVNISWTESSSLCVTNYRYNVSSTTIDGTTTSNSTVLEGLSQSNGTLCVVVATVDTANRTNSSDPVCFVINVPPAVDMLTATNGTMADTSLEVDVEWEEVDFDVLPDVIVPPLIGYRVFIVNATDSNDYSDVSPLLPLLPPGTTEYTFTGVPTGRTYNVTVIAINGVGQSEATVEFEAPGPFVELIPSSSSSAIVSMTLTSSSMTSSTMVTSSTSTSSPSSSTTTTTTSTTSSETISPSVGAKTSSLNVGGVVGGIVAAIIAVLIVVVVIIAIYFLCIRNKTKSVNLKQDGGEVVPMDVKSPEIGQALYQEVDKDTSNNDPPPSDSGAPTYQDPSTIKREQAPTGDLYTVPEKKSTPPNNTEPTQQVYAELDIHTKKPTGGSSSDKPVVIQGTTEPVIYADVRGQ